MCKEGCSFRIGSWNVHEGLDGDHKEYKLWEQLRSHRLEIACLQEVAVPRDRVEKDPDAARLEDRVHGDLVAQYLWEVSKFPHCAGVVLSSSSFSKDHYQALAILSKYPFEGAPEVYRLPNLEWRDDGGARLHDKGAIAVTAMIGDRRVRVVCLHGFPAHRFEIPVPSKEFDRATGLVGRIVARESEQHGEGGDLFILGDFNFDSRHDRIPDFDQLSIKSLFRNTVTRPGELCHDDVLAGDGWSCDEKVYPTESDHHLLVVSAKNAKLSTTEYLPRAKIVPRSFGEQKPASRLRGPQLPAPERFHEDRSQLQPAGR